MLTGLKVSLLACKYFKCFTDKKTMQIELNFEGLEIQKLNIPTHRTQRVGEKKGVICIVIMLTPRVMVIKMSKYGSFFVFSADDSKKIVLVWANYLNAPERSY